MMKSCPQCASDQLKKASLVHEEGTGVSVGIGVSTHGSVGVGGGVTASALALRCAPPKQRTDIISSRTGFAFIFGIVPVLIAGAAAGPSADIGTFWITWLILGLIVSCYCSFKDFDASKALHASAMEDYHKTYICGRCGTFSKPFD
jgi:hypothetical protein